MILVAPEKIEAYAARGWWGRDTLWQLFERRRAEHPDAEAVIDAPNRDAFAHGAPARWSWDELARHADGVALALLDAGLRRDERVVVQLPNCVEQFAVYLACARLGLIVSPVPVQYREHELEQILAITGAAAAVSFARIGSSERPHPAAQMFLDLRRSQPALRAVLVWGDAPVAGAIDLARPDGWTPSEAQRRRLLDAERAAAVTANDVFTICWTSGTEAQPKGVPRSHNEWLIVAPSIIDAARLQPRVRLLNPFPFVNMAGLSTAFAAWLVLGATVVQHHPFDLPVFLAQLRDERIDYTVAPPALLNMLLQNEALLAGIDFKRLARIGSGSAPLSEWMVRGFAERHGVQIVNYFGSNEGAALAGNDIDIPDPALRARVFPRADAPGREWSVSTTRKVRTRLVDIDSGRDIAEAGVPGELRFSGPTIFSGYFNAPEQSRRAFDEQGYYKSGDLFEIVGDALEFYRYVGRSKDLVIRGGVNISSEEIENLLLACPGVAEAAVVGVPDAALGERVCACVVARPGHPVSLETINAFLRDERRIAVFKLPERLLLLEALPRNPVGKLLKRDLREQAARLATATAPAQPV